MHASCTTKVKARNRRPDACSWSCTAVDSSLFAKHCSRRYQWAARGIVAIGALWQLLTMLPQLLTPRMGGKDSGLLGNDNADPGHELRDRWQSRIRVLTLALRGEHHQ